MFSSALVRADDVDPVSAFMAPTYISIGYDLVGRLNMVRQTLADISMSDAQRQQTGAIVDAAMAKINALTVQMQNGPLPAKAEVTGIPAYLQAGKQKIMDLLGPEVAGKLQAAMDSPRGLTRLDIDIIAAHVDQLKLDGEPAKQAKAAIDQAGEAAAKLPMTVVSGEDADKASAARSKLLANLHDQLVASLSVDQQELLGQHFADAQHTAITSNDKANGDPPTTRPIAQP